jgi:hypothetical protein
MHSRPRRHELAPPRDLLGAVAAHVNRYACHAPKDSVCVTAMETTDTAPGGASGCGGSAARDASSSRLCVASRTHGAAIAAALRRERRVRASARRTTLRARFRVGAQRGHGHVHGKRLDRSEHPAQRVSAWRGGSARCGSHRGACCLGTNGYSSGMSLSSRLARASTSLDMDGSDGRPRVRGSRTNAETDDIGEST